MDYAKILNKKRQMFICKEWEYIHKEKTLSGEHRKDERK